jgi:hypothetical protein
LTNRAVFAATPGGLAVFLFFSNRFGCLKSLLASAAITLVLLVLLGWIQL